MIRDNLSSFISPPPAILWAFCRTNRRFKFQKSSQLFIGTHNEALTVAAMCISNEDRPPVTIYGCNTAPTPTGFAEIVGNDFPVLHCTTSIFITG